MRFGQYLVDIGIFREVEIIFLITGHTKNICDRRFKDLKQNFHHRNVYTFNQLTAVMREGKVGQTSNPWLKVNAVEANAFYNWDKYLDLLYRKKIPRISTYHYFRFTASDAEMKTTFSSEATTKFKFCNLKKKATEEEKLMWENILKNQFPQQEKSPGLAEIKQVELFTKWRAFVPEEVRDDICPKPCQEVLDKVKNEKKEKHKVKLEALKKLHQDNTDSAAL